MKKFLTCQNNIPQNIGESDRQAQAQVGHVLSKEKIFTLPKYFGSILSQSLDHHGLITGYTKFGGRWIKVTVNLPKRK